MDSVTYLRQLESCDDIGNGGLIHAISDEYAALQAENERLKSVIYGRSAGSNLNELFGNSEELLVAIRGFISASWMPSKEESTEEMRQAYSYWRKRIIKAVGTMGYFDAEEIAINFSESDRHVELIDAHKGE